MKENRYDDAVFFVKYSQVNRSRQGLSGAGEWGAFKNLLPDFAGKGYWIWAAAMAGTACMRRSRGRLPLWG